MRLSIIIPFYNVEDFLPQCIESVMKLTKIEKEIILINDGSTDSSLQIAEKYKEEVEASEKGKIILINQENKGVGVARNAGINASTGDYIFFLDSDDWISTESFNSMILEFFEENSRVSSTGQPDVLLGKEIFYDEKRNIRKIEKEIPKQYLNRKIGGKEYLIASITKKFWNVRIPVGIYKKSLLTDNGIYFSETARSHEDELFITRIFYHAEQIETVNKIFGYYRVREGSIMSQLKPHHVRDILLNINEIKKIFEKEEDVQVKKAICYNIKKYYKEVLKKSYILEMKDFFNRVHSQFKYDCKEYLFKMTGNPFEKIEIYIIYYLKNFYYSIKIGSRKLKNIKERKVLEK